MKVLFVIATLSCVIPVSLEVTQQCVSCTGGSCRTSTPKTKSCDEKCYTMLLRNKSPDQDDPFVVKGCTSDGQFYRRSCVNKCYDSKKEFGSSLYYMCVHCCSGDRCNSSSRVKGGIIMVVVFAGVALINYVFQNWRHNWLTMVLDWGIIETVNSAEYVIS